MVFFKVKFSVFFHVSLFLLSVFCALTLNARVVEDLLIKDSRHAVLASESLLLSVEKNGDRIFVAGERGHILYSDDLGENWKQANVPVKINITDLHFVSEKEGWAVGHDAVILHTEDAGENWEIQFFDPDLDQPLMSLTIKKNVREASLYEINAVGAYGFFLNSMDSGKTWQEVQISDEDGHLNEIIQTPDHKYLIAGEYGYVYKNLSDKVWHAIKTPYEGSFFGAISPREKEYFVYGLRGSLYYSGDGGNHWKRIVTGTTSSFFGGTILKDGRIVLVGASGVLLIAEDSSNKRFSKHVFPDRKANSALIQLNKTALLIVGEGGIKKIDLSEIGG